MRRMHPGTALLYYAGAITGVILFNQPVCLGILLLGGAIQLAYLRGPDPGRILRKMIETAVFSVLFTGFFAVFCNFGITPVARILGNNVTVEAIRYGFVLALQIVSLLLWLRCVTEVFTEEKIIFLAGRIFPKGAAMLSLVFRMVPRIRSQAHRLREGRTGIGLGDRTPGHLLTEWSAMLTWLIDSLLGASASMRNRGFSLKGRTSYARYRFDDRDRSITLGIVLLMTVMIAGTILDQTRWNYVPWLTAVPVTGMSVIFYAAEALYVSVWVIGTAECGRERYGRIHICEETEEQS